MEQSGENRDETEGFGVIVNWFTGSAKHTLDPKGRIFIPANYRDALGDNFTIGLNNDLRTIAFYPKERWDEKCRQLSCIPETDIVGRNYIRFILSHAYANSNLDNQGRVLIPTELRDDFLDGAKEARFMGVGDNLELWHPGKCTGLQIETDELVQNTLKYINDTYFSKQQA